MVLLEETITSPQNKYVSLARGLANKKNRENERKFRFDGVKLMCEAIKNDVRLSYILANETEWNSVVEKAEKLSIEKLVSDKTPPAFVWHTFEDTVVPVQNSLLYAKALADNRVNCELHIYPHSEHGAALANGVVGRYVLEANGWMDLAIRWVNNL